MSSTARVGTLVVAAGSLGHAAGGVVDRAQSLAALWPGPVALVVTRALPRLIAQRLMPNRIVLVAPTAESASVLARGEDTPEAREVFRTLLALAATQAPVARLYAIVDPTLLPLLPPLVESLPALPVDVELLPAAGLPAPEQLWPYADSVIAPSRERLYALAGTPPALATRAVPAGANESALRALTHLPAFGGEARLSIVVPVRGDAGRTARLVDSVFEHTPALLELILVDDASPDGARGLLERKAMKENRLRLYVNDTQRGFAVSANRGIAASRGDVVIVLDAAAVVTPDWARRLVSHLALQPRAGVVGPLCNRAGGSQLLQPIDYDADTLAGLSDFALRRAREFTGRATGVTALSAVALAFSRPALRSVGGFDARFFPVGFEADDICVRLIAAGLVPYRANDVYIHLDPARSGALEPPCSSTLGSENWARFKSKWGLPADRPLERGYSIEEIDVTNLTRRQQFLPPWRELEPVGV